MGFETLPQQSLTEASSPGHYLLKMVPVQMVVVAAAAAKKRLEGFGYWLAWRLSPGG
jgi:hypothetical protein